MDPSQKKAFQDRISRIKGARPAQVVQAPPDQSAARFAKGFDLSLPDSHDMARAARDGKHSPLRPNYARNALYPLAVIGAFVTGAVALLVLKVVAASLLVSDTQHHLPSTWMIDLGYLIEGALAFVGSMALQTMLDHRGREYLVAQIFGVVAVMLTIHNVFHWYPTTTASLFGETYATRVIETTEANSLFLRGVTFSSDPDAPLLPRLAEPPLEPGQGPNLSEVEATATP
ncbi:MAG: hypothetical protein AAF667_03855 [Pseudomonadota bacterium]